jgi:GDP-4-dehydro-6-deoxy-D-mannose reductase
MRLLVTGADGFVGRWLVRTARAGGHGVVAAILPDAAPPLEWQASEGLPVVEVVRADFRQEEDVKQLGQLKVDAVAHLAAVASGTAARENPDAALRVNGVMTAYFADRLCEGHRPRFLYVSSGEVYGRLHDGPIPETARPHPSSPYAISKFAGEVALGMAWRDSGLPVIIARAFPHSGPGQSTAYVLPALAARLKEAGRNRASEVRTGNLSGVRDFLDVRDVVRAYLLLLEGGAPGEVYNVASGRGHRLQDCFTMLAALNGVTARAVEDAELLRPDDIPVLIGDAAKLRNATGWSPQIPFEQTLTDLVNAQTD